MTDKEILAELKKSYELLEDIIDNADNTQLQSVKELYTIQNMLGDKYSEVYEKIKNENDIELYYEEDIMISPNISGDYINVKDTEYNISYKDLENESKWWEDYGFLTEF